MVVKVTQNERKTNYSGIFINLAKKYNLFLILLLFIGIGSLISDKFFSMQNFMNIIQQSAFIGIISIGMTFVILVAGIDLSVGSVLALTGMCVSLLMSLGVPIPIAILVALIVGALAGFINGILSTKFKVPAFIATLAMMVSAKGLALLLTDGKPIYDFPEAFTKLGGNIIGNFPFIGLVWIVLTIISTVILNHSTFGRKLYAIGGNLESARLSGIKVDKYIILSFVICGLLSGLAGILMSAWLTVGQPTAGTGMELNVIAAVVLGGTSLAGGKGTIGGTFIGVLIMSLITNIFNLLGLSSYYQSIFMGIIIVTALMMNQFIGKNKNN